jgi:hypothetical protein
MMLARNMTVQAMKRYYENGGQIASIVEVTGKSYETVMKDLRSVGTNLVTGGHGRNR